MREINFFILSCITTIKLGLSKLRYYLVCSVMLIIFMLLSVISSAQKVNIIFDSDMGPDYDDAGAITLLHAFADSGKANILATVASTNYEGVAAIINVFNTYFKRPDVPVGVPKGEAVNKKDWQHWTDTLIANYPHTIRSNNEVPDAVEVYRKVLARQPDNSVIIVTVGFLTNISNLLQSKPDKYSKLDGQQLVNKKVKELVSMAGKFPEGKEFNIWNDVPASQYTYQHFTKPVIFSGFEIGVKIKCGLPLIHNNAIYNSPVKDVFRICIPMAAEDSTGRSSWDESAVLVAINGYKPYYKLQKGSVILTNPDGTNGWGKNGNQYYLQEASPVADVQQVIDILIQHQPKQ